MGKGVTVLTGSERTRKIGELENDNNILRQQNQEQQSRIEDLEEVVALLFVQQSTEGDNK